MQTPEKSRIGRELFSSHVYDACGGLPVYSRREAVDAEEPAMQDDLRVERTHGRVNCVESAPRRDGAGEFRGDKEVGKLLKRNRRPLC